MVHFRSYGVVQSFLLPALLLLLIPGFSLWFYNHAQRTFDARIVDNIVLRIELEQKLSSEQRGRLIRELEASPISKMVVSDSPEARAFTAQLPKDLKFRYWFFRIMARVGFYCILAELVMLVLMGISVHFSAKSQRSQYLSLAIGWESMRIFLSLQAMAQSVLVVSLSYWITALWVHEIDFRVIILAVMLAGTVLYMILVSIFRRVNYPLNVEGKIIERETAPAFWNDLEDLCDQVGTALPDQVIGGIDDNFFVTEFPVMVDEKKYKGRTLFISLSLLRIVPEDEAKSVLAHELAHFCGDDTYYSKKISPILNRYDLYLQALQSNPISWPLFFFALPFGSLHLANLRKIGREREFRADRIAAECTSPLACAGALLRIMAYTVYHTKTETEIYHSKETEANLVERLKDGFPSFAAELASQNEWGEESTVHPFDTHPPTSQRLRALGLELTSEFVSDALAKPADEVWYRRIPTAEVIENQLWTAYQQKFRASHEVSLAYRFLAETDEERTHIERHFPTQTMTLPKNTIVVIDFEKVTYTRWSTPVYWSEVLAIAAENDFGTNVIQFTLRTNGNEIRKLLLPKKQEEIGRLIQTLGSYFGR